MTRFQREGASLEALRASVLEEYGPAARIVAADRVTVGGIRGFFARQHYEVTVEVPDAPPQLDRPARLGIMALLADAEEAEAALHGVPVDAPVAAPASAPVSTASPDFAALMDDLTFTTATPPADLAVLNPEAARPAPPPAPLAGAGDLVVVLGLGLDPQAVAQSMAEYVSRPGQVAEVTGAGLLARTRAESATDRRRALACRARGVQNGAAVFLAFGLDWSDGEQAAASVTALEADQLWVAVDAGRKSADTARWVGAIARRLPIDGVAVVDSTVTGSPGTVTELGFPVGWADGAPVESRAPRRLGRHGR